MLKIHLRQPGFTYSVCWPFTKNKERIKRFEETAGSWCIYQNEEDEACFQYDMAYEDFKNLSRRTTSDKKLLDKAYSIAKNQQYDGYQRGLASMVYNFLIKTASSGAIEREVEQNKELAEKLQRPIIRKFEKSRVHSCFIDKIFGSDLADMQLISRFNKIFRFLLCVIDICSR